jgi:membrane protease YdiL (CAAX protease family)
MDEDIRGGLSQVFYNPQEERLRTPFRLGTALLLLLGVFLFVAGVLAALDTLVGGAGDGVASLLLAVAFTLALLAIAWLVDRRYLGDLGLDFGRAWARDLAAGLGVGLVMAAGAVGVGVAAGVASVEGTLVTGDGGLVDGPLPVALLGSLVLFLLLAFLEELFFRGYVLVNLAEGLRGFTDVRRGAVVAVSASAVLFGFVHVANPDASAISALNITLFGLLLGSAYVLTDRLAIPVGIHAAWNFALGPVFGTPVSGLDSGVALVDVSLEDSLLAGGAFGLEGGLLALVALAVGTAGLLGWVRLSTGDISVREQVAEPDLWSRE